MLKNTVFIFVDTRSSLKAAHTRPYINTVQSTRLTGQPLQNQNHKIRYFDSKHTILIAHLL